MFPAQHKAGVHHDIMRSREEATGTPKARHIGVVPSIISIDGASIIVIALTLAGQEPLGDPDVGWRPEAGQGGPEAGGGFGALGDLWRGLTTGAGGQRDRSPTRRYQGVP